MPLREGVARAFPRVSPRNLRLTHETSSMLSESLSSRSYQRILVQDFRKRVLRKTFEQMGWKVERAVPNVLKHECSTITTYDLPLDDNLIDINGLKPDLANTNHMSGISVNLGGRKAWAFYSDDGDTARVVSEGERKQGMFVATRTEDIFETADCLLKFLAASKKSWAVFSVDIGRFVRQYDPIMLTRMSLERPKAFDHKGTPLSKSNRKEAIGLFSEYYDESTVQSMLRLRRFKADGNYSIFLVDGGFAITRLEGETGLIYDIYVNPSNQGRGLGEELMRCALTSLAGRVSSVYLHTSYPRAKKLYEKFGFKAVYEQLGIRLDEIALSPPQAR
jgi:ribosomal protein S18 acetylase RimI-like enzyme